SPSPVVNSTPPSRDGRGEHGGSDGPRGDAWLRPTECDQAVISETVPSAADRLRPGTHQAVEAADGPAPRVPGGHTCVAGEDALCGQVRPETVDEAADLAGG